MRELKIVKKKPSGKLKKTVVHRSKKKSKNSILLERKKKSNAKKARELKITTAMPVGTYKTRIKTSPVRSKKVKVTTLKKKY
ncbi:MAG TPA: hypothetical protein ENG81_04410 [Candidatus Bathyarchaeota archaeon]|nr:hypothetical protein [Candidatus Bathyarchaeota archaeon]